MDFDKKSWIFSNPFTQIQIPPGEGDMKLKNRRLKPMLLMLLVLAACLLIPLVGFASEADLAIPALHKGAPYTKLGDIRPWDLLFYGACIIAGTLGISLYLRPQGKKLNAHA